MFNFSLSLWSIVDRNGHCFVGFQAENKIATLQQEENDSMKTGMH